MYINYIIHLIDAYNIFIYTLTFILITVKVSIFSISHEQLYNVIGDQQIE